MADAMTTILMSRRAQLSLLALFGFLLWGRAPAQAQQFSADLFMMRSDGAAVPAGKLRVLDDKVRIETPEYADGFFLVGLSNVDSERTRNLQLLKERSWFDVPLVYSNQRRAIIAIEKGAPGERAFNEAFAAWGE